MLELSAFISQVNLFPQSGVFCYEDGFLSNTNSLGRCTEKPEVLAAFSLLFD